MSRLPLPNPAGVGPAGPPLPELRRQMPSLLAETKALPAIRYTSAPASPSKSGRRRQPSLRVSPSRYVIT
eukprot:6213181-Pleurochrysis_carterae.AAC.1